MAGPSHYQRQQPGVHPVVVPKVRALYRHSATLLGASMWFWLMYRVKKDGKVITGLKHPWDH